MPRPPTRPPDPPASPRPPRSLAWTYFGRPAPTVNEQLYELDGHSYVGLLVGLILKLLIRVPLRQRNVRELQYPKHLWQDASTGEWTLRFTGKELKVAMRKGQVNVFEVRLSRLYPKDGPTPDDFIPTLETFINDYRPLLPGAQTSPSLFLTQCGNPFSSHSLRTEIVTAMERGTGVKLNPHMIRDIAATTLLRNGRSYDMVAALLGNTVATVIQHYAHLIPEEQIALATGDLGKILRTG